MKTQNNILYLIICLFFSACTGIVNEDVELEDVISFAVLDQNDNPIEEVIGDGQTIIKLRAIIPSDADISFRKVTFKKSDGQFTGIAGDTGEITANADGIAEVSLDVPLDDGILFLSAEVTDTKEVFKVEKQINLISVNQVIDLAVLDAQGQPITGTVRADGTTLLTLRATVNFNQENFNQIKFEKSEGTFVGVNANNGLELTNDNNQATITFKVPETIGRIFFRASAVSNTEILKDTFIDLERANADGIIIEPSTLTINPNQPIQITTYLTRTVGNVSIGTPAEFKAFQLNSSNEEIEVGRFTGEQNANTSNASGIISSVSFLADTNDFIDTAAPVFIRVSTETDTGTIISETITLNFT